MSGSPYLCVVALSSPPPGQVRRVELLAVLSLGADLGLGQPMEHAMRQCLISLRLGDIIGLDEHDQAVLYYVGLIAWIGCHIDAYEQAKWFGDDLALKGHFRLVDAAGIRSTGHMLGQIGAGRHGLVRAGVALRFFTGGMSDAAVMLHNHWYAANQLSCDLGLANEVGDVLRYTFERWDGKGPGERKGDAIPVVGRIVNLADVTEVFHRAGGVDAAVDVAQARRGTQFDPRLVDLVAEQAASLFADIDGTTWDTVIALEPGPTTYLARGELDAALEAIGDFIDVKSPFTLGHTRAVAELATAAATAMGVGASEVTHVRHAAYLHDLGRLGVSNAIWDKASELSVAEAERVRMHPYLTERMLASSPALAPLGATASQHHERLDGSGYPRGLRGDALAPNARLLAAVDSYVAKLEPRPHRPALDAAAAARHLRDEVRAGRHDGDAVDAVLAAAGHRPRRRREWPGGLTTREVEVLRLLVRGLSNKQVAERLVIARKTVDNHVEHIYTKIGASNRAQASLFAVRNALMTPEDEESHS
jgi:HD-GYP domain-containing protein (c-di-GMP phosphodiesterase class II)